MSQGRKVGMLPYGNGCKLYRDCFTCPAPDCVSFYGASLERQERIIETWRPYFEKVKAKG